MALTSRTFFAREVAVRLDPGAGAGAAVDPAGVFLAEEERGPDVVARGARFGRGGGFGGLNHFRRRELDGWKDRGGGKNGFSECSRRRYDCGVCVIDGGAVGQL